MTGEPVSTTPPSRSASWPAPPPGRPTLRLLGLALLGLGCGMILAQPASMPVLTTLAGALLAMVLPGLALSRALFPGAGMGRAERVALTIGLQLALVVLCGFLLHLLRPGLSVASWGALLSDITLLACGVAWIRSRRVDGTSPIASNGAVRSPGWLAGLANAPTAQVGMLVGAGLVAVLALVVARVGVEAQPQPAWTALAITAGEGGRAVEVGITNAEGRPETYRLVATIDGELLATIDGLALADDASLARTIALPPGGAFLREVDVGLWRSDDPQDGGPYRRVRLSLRGVPGS
jgi:uncharacterized membrane protein